MHKLSLLLVLLVATRVMATTVVYTPDDRTDFANPERGFYSHTEQVVKSDGKTSLSASQLSALANDGMSLILRLYYLDKFRTVELPQTVLDMITSDMALMRNNGVKCVLRFAYTADNDSYPYKDGSPSIWQTHLSQLKPILHDNADVIAVVQAGFLGAWGEWYYSSQGTGEEIPQSVKNNLINQLLDAVPTSRAVQLRTPDYKRDYLGIKGPMPSTQAFSGTPRARLGHHNDAFLYQEDNMGTYSNRTVDMNYLDQECMYLPNGGETDVYKESVYKAWATGDKAQAEMAKLHYSYLNSGYCALTLNHWREDGSYAILSRHMGYRLQLVEATLPSAIQPTATLPVRISIRNTGYAPMYNERHAYLVLHNTTQTYALLLDTDPRLWAPNSAIAAIEQEVALPANIVPGTYQAALWLPDDGKLIKNDPRYAIRFANTDVWDSKTGYNELGIAVVVTNDTPQLDTIPQPSMEVDPITNLTAEAGNRSAVLNWTNPFAASESGKVPLDMSVGEPTFSGNGGAEITDADSLCDVHYVTNSTWHWAGVDFPISQIEDITSISFEIKGDGAEVVVYPYANDGSYRWYDSDQEVTLSSTSWTQYTITPKTAIWEDETPTHHFGEQTITNIGFIANPATATIGAFQLRNITLMGKSSKGDGETLVRILRKEGALPNDYNDGTVVYIGTEDTYTDTNLSGATYYYAAYAVYKDGRIAQPATCSVEVESTATQSTFSGTTSSVQKVLHNGQLYIIRDGITYDLYGRRY